MGDALGLGFRLPFAVSADTFILAGQRFARAV